MDLSDIAKEVRKDILFEVYSASSGHIGGALSCADILTAIYFNLIEEGDKVILSKGHACAALYAVLAEKGFFEKEELKTFRRLNSRLQGHPAYIKTPGIDSSSGSLGQGLSIGNGIALSFKLNKKPNHVYVILGDGEIEEGQVWEALMSCSKYKLNNVIIFLDNNNLQIDGSNDEVMPIAPIKEKIQAFGLNTIEIDGHNFDEIISAVNEAKRSNRPTFIIAKTVKGKGISFMENKAEWHGTVPNEEEYKLAIKELEE